MTKQTIAIIYGGTNTEHEVSIVSARSIMESIDTSKYNLLPILISKSNQWTSNDQVITPSELLSRHVDVVFPILHGPYGEDGTIQGLLEMLQLPYVGCGVLASAICMDKVIQKQLCGQQGIPVAPFVWTVAHEWQTDKSKTLQYVANKLQYPLFVKPANQGSSIGITKVHTEVELQPAIESAFQFDTKIIIEQGVANAREIECAVLGNHEPKASVLGEINPSNEFYDYDAKYVDGKSEAHIPANLPAEVATKVQNLALKAFQVLSCSGLARIDFLIDGSTYDIFLNELNTMPGFTSISMYPKLWAATGRSYPQLLEELITLAIERQAETTARVLTYTPKLNWHQR